MDTILPDDPNASKVAALRPRRSPRPTRCELCGSRSHRLDEGHTQCRECHDVCDVVDGLIQECPSCAERRRIVEAERLGEAQARAFLATARPALLALERPGAARTKQAAAAAVVLDAGADWIDQIRSPLGRRKHMRLCREGVFQSARKEGKRWLVRRAEIDSHIENQEPPRPADVSEIDRELAALGMLDQS